MNQNNKVYNLIMLNESEKFRNAEGEICDVEVRGDRTRKGTYFKVKDIGRVFDIKRLDNDIANKRTRYNSGEHYIRITEESFLSKSCDGDYYFTSEGLYTWLFNAKDTKTKHYIDWMMDTLFTVQFGTQEEKEELVGVSRSDMMKGLKLSANKVGGLYLIELGTIKKLKRCMELGDQFDDDSVVCKFGFSNDIKSRFYQHEKKLGVEVSDAKMKLLFYATIQDPFLSHSERQLHNYFEMVKMEWEDHDELVVLSRPQIKLSKKKYQKIAEGYTSNTSTEVTELETKVKKLKIQRKQYKKDYEEALLKMGKVGCLVEQLKEVNQFDEDTYTSDTD